MKMFVGEVVDDVIFSGIEKAMERWSNKIHQQVKREWQITERP